MNGPNPTARALPALLLMLLAGCGNILTSQQPVRHHYLLSPYTAAPTQDDQQTAPELTLSLAAIPGLDTDRILALGTDARLNHYANARWPDHLPEVLVSVIRRSLEATGRYAAVRAAEPGAEEGWALTLEVREFYGIQDSSGATAAVRVSLAGTLACGGATHALSLTETTPVVEERLVAVVAAHQAGLDGVTRRLIDRAHTLCGARTGAES